MRNSIIVTSLSMLLAGCRSPGLPPEPPATDAANPEAGAIKARPQPNPFTRSAFEGVKLDGGGHEHHHHGGHGAGHGAKPAGDAKAEAPAPAAPAKDPHASHGGRS